MRHDEFLRYFKRLCQDEGTRAAWAKKHGFSATYVSDMINKRRAPSEAICAAAGVKRETIYRKVKT
jgi:predicted DNA-binding transcriptional regulator AlpA